MGFDTWGNLRLSPICMLAFFGFTEALVYMDRSVFGVLVPILKSDDGLSLTASQMGLIGSSFIFGYMIASPLFGHFSQYYHPLFLMGLGITILGLAELSSGLARSFWFLLLARTLTGVGDAAIISLAPSFISDIAPADRKGIWVASFYASINVGNAIGFIFGNYISELLGGWYWPLIIESMLLVPSILLCFLLYKDPKFLNIKDTSLDSTMNLSTLQTTLPLHQRLKLLLHNRCYVFLVLGYATYAFSYGGWQFWSTDFLIEVYGLSAANASYVLAFITFFFGVSGPLIGSYFLDKRMKKISKLSDVEQDMPEEVTEQHRRFESSRIVSCACMSAGILGATGILINTLVPFLICYSASEFFQKMQAALVGICIMSSVSKEMRGLANGMAVFIMLFLGGLPSPYVIGMLGENINKQFAMLILISVLILGGFFYSFVWFFTTREVKSFKYDITLDEKHGEKFID